MCGHRPGMPPPNGRQSLDGIPKTLDLMCSLPTEDLATTYYLYYIQLLSRQQYDVTPSLFPVCGLKVVSTNIIVSRSRPDHILDIHYSVNIYKKHVLQLRQCSASTSGIQISFQVGQIERGGICSMCQIILHHKSNYHMEIPSFFRHFLNMVS